MSSRGRREDANDDDDDEKERRRRRRDEEETEESNGRGRQPQSFRDAWEMAKEQFDLSPLLFSSL